ncbi:membrane protein insertion efficiency factor YidD [Romboutsia ilealis]|jgi:putative membrane protein insertion efficiency factor|uniref:membrane protein insertion efficiency factor YidD n=2 Tax=Clostridia TaxID=186801 RepID=UPI002F4126A4
MKMKRILIKLIKLYQICPLRCHNNCKFIPRCSDYAIESLNNYGTLKGTYLTIRRLMRCNPFNKGGFDPVPTKHD